MVGNGGEGNTLLAVVVGGLVVVVVALGFFLFTGQQSGMHWHNRPEAPIVNPQH